MLILLKYKLIKFLNLMNQNLHPNPNHQNNRNPQRDPQRACEFQFQEHRFQPAAIEIKDEDYQALNDQNGPKLSSIPDWNIYKYTIFILLGINLVLAIGLGAAALSKIRQQEAQIENLSLQLTQFSQNTNILQQNFENLKSKFNEIIDLKGIPGPIGIEGAQGPEGVQGPAGVQGPPGEDSELTIGSIIFHGTNNGIIDSVSKNSTWVVCDGRLLLRSKYPALFELLGTTFGGGDGVYSFRIPDFRGRAPIGSGQSNDGLSSRAPGDKGGVETVILTEKQMPSHFHKQGGEGLHNDFGGGNYIGDRTYYLSDLPSYIQQWTSLTGGDEAHENMMPFLSLYAMIRIL